MNTTRIGYLLTTNEQSERYIFSKNLLEKIGFTVHCVKAIPHENKMLSNKLSMQYIYDKIQNSEEGFYYVFEDDINILDNITLDEIIEYEKISPMFFFLGICETTNIVENTGLKINDYEVYSKSGNVRGHHAIGLSRVGAELLLKFSKDNNYYYSDEFLEEFSKLYPANIVRYDLESDIHGHKGIMFQDRNKFPSIVNSRD